MKGKTMYIIEEKYDYPVDEDQFDEIEFRRMKIEEMKRDIIESYNANDNNTFFYYVELVGMKRVIEIIEDYKNNEKGNDDE
jgi:hypothetical protein